LNTQPFLRTARITLDDGVETPGIAPRHFVAKFPDPVAGKYRGASFAERRYANERTNYHFLMSIRHRFTQFPALVAQDGDLILLEDLGRSGKLPPDRLGPALAAGLARLHGATAPGALDPRDRVPETDPVQQERRGIIGLATERLADQARIMLGHPTEAFATMMALVEADIADPGPFHAFIHADLADQRQMVWHGEHCLFLDFELAYFGHSLLDVAVALIGKAEFLQKPARLVYNRLPLAEDFSGSYRAFREEAGDLRVDDVTWARHLAAALLYAGLFAIGQFHHLHEFPAFSTLARSQRQILLRILETAPHEARHGAFIDLLRAVARRIA
jgi:hypothetical protein